jgi:hypothetical protein
MKPLKSLRTTDSDNPGWLRRLVRCVRALGNTHPNTCGMTQCRYCYNEDTQRIIHPYDLQPFVAYYGDKNFQVYSCYLCGGLWHWEMPNGA